MEKPNGTQDELSPSEKRTPKQGFGRFLETGRKRDLNQYDKEEMNAKS